ncbi:DUF6270 domain-containing protein [Priestia megaterium]|uniref:DUF6270 domain-containing protein n=1 Tax=Priestia megaterium TaxID=1404 RepID=UPI000BF57103|nr:DUF6270 domain-containing protein [Priestia megaterium]PFD99388.1 hypothetical protein CN265_12585 [Priestia megaterium]
MNKKIDILGSCVSRDPFAMFDHEYEINSYFARTNIISLASNSMNISIHRISLESNFQKRCVYNDLNKLFFKNVRETEAQVLIIDLLSERLRIMKRGESYFTYSDEFTRSNLVTDLKGKQFADKTDELWKSSADRFIEEINNSSIEQVIIHKALWQEKYVDKDGMIQSFDNIEEIHSNNEKLEYMYSYLADNIHNACYLEIKGEVLADENHKWGLSPRHYESSYYQKFLHELNNLTQKNKIFS